ncbi:P-loop containing nucleoside triphosphate hydrolase protein [Xylaria sp. FL1777]|nr:P-loop containing nucleoside triphosphate hydrolase protein [Xylaria sp. FL1777]
MEGTTKPYNEIFIFVLGPPGSGKGTHCNRVTKMLTPPRRCYRHLSVGDYLRDLRDSKTPYDVKSFDRDMVREYLQDSKLLPAQVLIPLLKHKIDSTPSEKGFTTTWLIDGFPRNMETALAFEEKIGKPVAVIALKCDRDEAGKRFLKRGREQIDDKGRFNKRYDEYVQNMGAIQKHYESILESISVDRELEYCTLQFMAALPPASGD